MAPALGKGAGEVVQEPELTRAILQGVGATVESEAGLCHGQACINEDGPRVRPDGGVGVEEGRGGWMATWESLAVTTVKF